MQAALSYAAWGGDTAAARQPGVGTREGYPGDVKFSCPGFKKRSVQLAHLFRALCFPGWVWKGAFVVPADGILFHLASYCVLPSPGRRTLRTSTRESTGERSRHRGAVAVADGSFCFPRGSTSCVHKRRLLPIIMPEGDGTSRSSPEMAPPSDQYPSSTSTMAPQRAPPVRPCSLFGAWS